MARGKAFAEAQQVAAMLKRRGYPDAEPAPQYCIDPEIGQDNFYTYTVSVYAGEKQPETIKQPKTIAPALQRIARLLGIGTN